MAASSALRFSKGIFAWTSFAAQPHTPTAALLRKVDRTDSETVRQTVSNKEQQIETERQICEERGRYVRKQADM